MSYSASAATETAVSASISTPVLPVTRTSASISTASSSTVSSTATREIGSGWQSGIRSLVLFAARMPATRATPSASPLGTSPARSRAAVAGAIRTRPRATARRLVSAFSVTSTMCASPASFRCVSFISASDREGPIRVNAGDRAEDRPDAAGDVVAKDEANEERNPGAVGLHAAVPYDQPLDAPSDEGRAPEPGHGGRTGDRVADRMERPPGEALPHHQQSGRDEQADAHPLQAWKVGADRIVHPVLQRPPRHEAHAGSPAIHLRRGRAVVVVAGEYGCPRR